MGNTSLQPARLSSTAAQTYATVLSSLAIVTRSEWRHTANRQLAILTFFAFLTFFFLDAWPYATYDQLPYHDIKDLITWIRLGLLTLAGVFVSLFSPRPASTQDDLYVTLNSFVKGILQNVKDEDAVSLFSRVTYGYLSNTVFHAWRVPSITIDEMPEIAPKETSTSLRRKTFPVSRRLPM